MQLAVEEILDTTIWKVDLPESILQSLTAGSDIEYPLIFSLQGPDRKTHVGVREFSANESAIRISSSIAQSLNVSVGSVVNVNAVSLPKGTAVKLRTEADLDWKPLLERWLPLNCTALSVGDVLMVDYLGQAHRVTVEELDPESAVCVIDTDLDLEIVGGQHLDSSVEFEYDTPVLLSDSVLSKKTPDYLHIDASNGVLYIGPEFATSLESFTFRVAGTRELQQQDLERLGDSFSICGYGSAKLSITRPVEPVSADSQLCPTCSKYIPTQSFVLHSSFCQRNTVRCDCGEVFNREIPKDHWHCSNCSAHGVGFEDVHSLEHSQASCTCGKFDGSFLETAYHRASDCEYKVIVCRFCHLKVPQGLPSATDRALGITGHESDCGNRTAACHVCSRPVRLRNMDAHMQQHDVQRKSRSAPVTCSNQNCVAVIKEPTNKLGLCTKCFGPLFSLDSDPDGSRLRSRIERRYVLQLSTGCGKSWCTNKYCRTASGEQKPFKEILPLVKDLMSQEQFYFCVDQIMSKKSMFVYEDGVYDRAWRSLAIYQCATETEAEEWLQIHAPKLSEV